MRPYMGCMSYIGGFRSLVSVAYLEVGGKYIIHAGGKSDEPRCLPMYMNKGGKSRCIFISSDLCAQFT